MLLKSIESCNSRRVMQTLLLLLVLSAFSMGVASCSNEDEPSEQITKEMLLNNLKGKYLNRTYYQHLVKNGNKWEEKPWGAVGDPDDIGGSPYLAYFPPCIWSKDGSYLVKHGVETGLKEVWLRYCEEHGIGSDVFVKMPLNYDEGQNLLKGIDDYRGYFHVLESTPNKLTIRVEYHDVPKEKYGNRDGILVVYEATTEIPTNYSEFESFSDFDTFFENVIKEHYGISD